jgi:hypothetical protein
MIIDHYKLDYAPKNVFLMFKIRRYNIYIKWRFEIFESIMVNIIILHTHIYSYT